MENENNVNSNDILGLMALNGVPDDEMHKVSFDMAHVLHIQLRWMLEVVEKQQDVLLAMQDGSGTFMKGYTEDQIIRWENVGAERLEIFDRIIEQMS